MRNLFRRLLRSAPAPQPASPVAPAHPASQGVGLDVYQGDEPGDLSITRYPPFDKGIPLIPVERILHAQQELLDRVFRTAGVSREEFETFYMPAVRNLAEHVHLLPATSTTYFRGTGGLFRMSLEIALNSLQSANAAVFPTGGGVERRFFMQPKWTLATFLAGLCSQNYRTVNSMAVMTRDSQQWTPLISSLYRWCASLDADAYFVRWMEEIRLQGAQASAAYSISQVVPSQVLQYLASDNNQVVQSMTAAIAGTETNTSENPIGRLVAPVITRVIEDDLKRSATNYGHLVIGAHLEMHLVDAMRRLVRSGKWIANNLVAGGRVWVGKEGVFIDWTPAAADIANLLARDSFAGIPQDPDTLADLLVSANLLQDNARGARYWTITLPVSYEVKEGMVKLRDGEVIFPQGFDFSPFRNVELTQSGPSGAARAKTVGREDAASDATRHEMCEMPVPEAPAPAEPGSMRESPERAKSMSPRNETQQNANAETVAASPRRGNGRKQIHPSSGLPFLEGAAEDADGQIAARQEEANDDAPEREASVARTKKLQSRASGVEKMLAALKPENAMLLNEVLESCRNGAVTGVAVELPYGFGISHEEFSRHGIPIMDLLEELGLKGWLWQDRTRASRRIHPVEVGGKTHRMIILKPDIAAGLGCVATVAKE